MTAPDQALKAAVERVTQVAAMTLNGLTILRSISDVYHPIKGQPARLMFASDIRTALSQYRTLGGRHVD